MRESYEILKEVIDRVGVKKVAARLGVSSSLVYKWCQKPEDPDSLEFNSGAINPLDRIRMIYEETQDPQLIQWFCQLANGFLVNNPQKGLAEGELKLLENIQRFITEFSETLNAISSSYEGDRRITADEAKRIRKEWEDLKRIGEAFVCACEAGRFG
jgi:hypothetical protein